MPRLFCKTCLMFILLAISLPRAFSQSPILSEFDFAKGGFCILKVPADFETNDDAMVAYFNDIPTLLRLQRELSFHEDSTANRISYCKTDCYLYVCQNGKYKKMMSISEACQWIRSASKYYKFDGYFPYTGYKLAKAKHETFPDLATARKRWQELQAPNKSLYIENVLWDDYEGEFSFYVPSTEEKEPRIGNGYYQNLFQSKFPNERFRCVGKTFPTRPAQDGRRHMITVWCNKSLFDKFDLFPVADEGWKYFKLELSSYWPQ